MVASFAEQEDREFLMTDKDFSQIAKLAGDLTGIVLAEHKRSMVYSRIARRVRMLNFSDFRQYLDYLENNLDKESTDFINSLTTNLTSFFREMHHFRYLKDELLPALRVANSSSKKLRIWSAGSSTGMEAYSIAMTVKQAGFPSGWDIKILATDLDSEVLETGRKGVYSMNNADGLDDVILKKYFRHSKNGRSIQIKDELRDMVHFKRLNLLENWPMQGLFDIVFCRNVVIYFNKDTQRVLFDRIANMMPVGASLMIGHSENLSGISDRFESLGQTIYRKVR